MIIGKLQQKMVYAPYLAVCPMLSCRPSPDTISPSPRAFIFANNFCWYFFQWMNRDSTSLFHQPVPVGIYFFGTEPHKIGTPYMSSKCIFHIFHKLMYLNAQINKACKFCGWDVFFCQPQHGLQLGL